VERHKLANEAVKTQVDIQRYAWPFPIIT